MVCQLPCSHRFCLADLMKWMSDSPLPNGRVGCPMCRKLATFVALGDDSGRGPAAVRYSYVDGMIGGKANIGMLVVVNILYI